jgi:hypothetical protein
VRMRVLTLAVAALFLAPGIATAVEIVTTPKAWNPDDIPSDCPIRVDFISYCCGFDMEEYRRVISYVRASDFITAATEIPWGMEGERTLCLRFDDPGAASRAFEELKALLPKRQRASMQGPTGVLFWTGEGHITQDSP